MHLAKRSYKDQIQNNRGEKSSESSFVAQKLWYSHSLKSYHNAYPYITNYLFYLSINYIFFCYMLFSDFVYNSGMTIFKKYENSGSGGITISDLSFLPVSLSSLP